MWQTIAKIAISALLITGISDIAKRSSFWAAALASLPLTSLLAFVWLYLESGDAQRVASLSQSIFWLVLPSLPLFLLLPVLLRLGAACAVTALIYVAMVWLLGRFGVQL